MNFDALVACFGQMSCVVTQTTSALIIGMLLFLVASGVTLIFGVLNVVNFAHGTLYMLGAYIAYAVYVPTESYTLAVLAGAIGVGIFGIMFERFLISRVYGPDVLMQLLVCYGVVLVMDDVVKIIWGVDFMKMAMPAAFRLPPIRIGGGFVPPFYLFLICISMLIGLGLWYIITQTRYGKMVRAAAVNPSMVSALGIRTPLLFASVFGLGAVLAGAAGALAAPVRALTPGMGFSIVIESFIVTVIGGMGSIGGAFAAAILLGFVRSYGSVGFPLFVDGLMFLIMGLVLVFKPAGLFGRSAR